jgi:hypothetical protein
MKLALIKEQGPCPPDGFRYVDPVDGFVAHAWTYNDWIPLEVAHLRANGREVPDTLALSMQDQLCRTLPPGWCDYDDPSRPCHGRTCGFRPVDSGGTAYVPQEEAERRALICSRCYLNVNVEGCGACHKAVAEVTKDRKTKLDYMLRACAACKCLLKAKVHFPMETLDSEAQGVQELYPDFCWLKKGGENYRG